MRIGAIRLQRLRVPLDPPFPAAWDPVPRTSFPVTIVRVETAEGVVGIGSGDTMDGFEAFEHLFIGQDPLDIERHVRVLETIDFHAGRYWPLEAALWDIAGQVAGIPVAGLFGGKLVAIPAYASCGMLLPAPERAESALRMRDEGFRALKIRVDPRRLEEGLAAVSATRAAVGDSMDIMVDLNQGWRMAGDTTPSIDVATAREIGARLADESVLWMEEPLDGSDFRLWRVIGDDDGAGDPESSRVPGHALRHVACARRVRPLSQALFAGEQHGIPGAANLERADRLQVLELEPDLAVDVGQLEPNERRADDEPQEPLACGLDVGERDVARRGHRGARRARSRFQRRCSRRDRRCDEPMRHPRSQARAT